MSKLRRLKDRLHEVSETQESLIMGYKMAKMTSNKTGPESQISKW